MASQDADEYPAGVSDARLAACQQDVLKMVELAAQVAEGLAANVDPEAEGSPFELYDGEGSEIAFEKWLILGDDRNTEAVYVNGKKVM